ncbi:head-tail connector protein [Oceaniovalibus sp. ACAM 378]|uniref:head-tail connector protein n=1 Tax=Oceaniovalibus sp. ACAM 378 TaxID=2599923 RepID=UPI0011D93752|nr:head-tail connector protein [Oceaniovalibus sp. ACAM 378]TYB85524.1 phage gp6-like head-tail connector protein [Oceaniovalibus sp. ACAM 378]
MTAQTPVALLKSQLNIDHDLDGALLAHKLGAAEIWIANYTGVPFDGANAAQVEAALQLASYWFEQREAAFDGSSKAIPFGVRDLLESFKDQVTGHGA